VTSDASLPVVHVRPASLKVVRTGGSQPASIEAFTRMFETYAHTICQPLVVVLYRRLRT